MHYTQDPKVIAAARAYVEFNCSEDNMSAAEVAATVAVYTSDLQAAVRGTDWKGMMPNPVSFWTDGAISPHTGETCHVVHLIDQRGYEMDPIYVETAARQFTQLQLNALALTDVQLLLVKRTLFERINELDKDLNRASMSLKSTQPVEQDLVLRNVLSRIYDQLCQGVPTPD